MNDDAVQLSEPTVEGCFYFSQYLVNLFQSFGIGQDAGKSRVKLGSVT